MKEEYDELFELARSVKSNPGMMMVVEIRKTPESEGLVGPLAMSFAAWHEIVWLRTGGDCEREERALRNLLRTLRRVVSRFSGRLDWVCDFQLEVQDEGGQGNLQLFDLKVRPVQLKSGEHPMLFVSLRSEDISR